MFGSDTCEIVPAPRPRELATRKRIIFFSKFREGMSVFEPITHMSVDNSLAPCEVSSKYPVSFVVPLLLSRHAHTLFQLTRNVRACKYYYVHRPSQSPPVRALVVQWRTRREGRHAFLPARPPARPLPHSIDFFVFERYGNVSRTRPRCWRTMVFHSINAPLPAHFLYNFNIFNYRVN